MRRFALLGAFIVLAVATPASGDPLSNAPSPDLDIYIVGGQFMYQSGVDATGSFQYTPVMRPAAYVSTPMGTVTVSNPPQTYWFRNITNLDSQRHTFTQCGTRPTGIDVGRLTRPPTCTGKIHGNAIWFDISLDPGQRYTFTPGRFPDNVHTIEFYSKTSPWMRGAVRNRGFCSFATCNLDAAPGPG